MTALAPKVAAELAEQVYAVNGSAIDMRIFLARPEFSNKSGDKQSLNAEI